MDKFNQRLMSNMGWPHNVQVKNKKVEQNPLKKTDWSHSVNSMRGRTRKALWVGENNKNMSTYKVNIPAGPLWSNDEAQEIGPLIAAAHQGKFTGQWKTVVEGQMSVVEIELQVKKEYLFCYSKEISSSSSLCFQLSVCGK